MVRLVWRAMTEAAQAPVLLVHWEETVGLVLDKTSRFPKSARFTFASRMDSLVLDILEDLVRASWAPPVVKAPLLASADGHLGVLRVLVRIAFERQLLPRAGFEHLVRRLDEAGRMLGGWRKQVGG